MGKGEPTDEKVKIILTQSEKERVTCMLISRTVCPEQKAQFEKGNVQNLANISGHPASLLKSHASFRKFVFSGRTTTGTVGPKIH